jgi:hypothetical protein
VGTIRRRLDLSLAAVLLAAAAAPFWAGRFLPFLDLPQHLGLAAVVARHAQPSSALSRYYAVDLHLIPYWGYYGAMWALSRALPVEAASRVLFSAYAVSVPLASAFLLASFGRDRRWAVFSVPLAFGTNLFFGFATFLLSVPLFLLALGLAERHFASARMQPRVAVPLAVTACAVYLFHAQTYVLLGLCTAALLALHGRRVRWFAARSLAFLPSLALFGTWFGRSFVAAGRKGVEEHTAFHRTYGGFGALGAVWEGWRVVLGKIPERLFGAFTDGSDLWLGGLLLVVFVVALALAYGPAPVADRPLSPALSPAGRGRGRMSGARDPDRDRGSRPPIEGRGEGRLRCWLLAHRCDALVLALLASYLFAPMEISGQWYVNPRHLLFAALLLPLLLARPASGLRSAVAAVAAIVALATCANAAREIRAFQRQVGPFDVVAARLPPGGRVLGLPFDFGSSGPVRLWPFLHFACFEQVLADGDVGFSFAGLPSIPVAYRPGMQAPHPYEWTPQAFDWASMGRFYDAFLVSGAPRGRGGDELRRHAEVVATAGPFTLWKPRDGLTGRSPSSR